MSGLVNQRGASARGDVVGGNKITTENHYHVPPTSQTIIGQLLQKLREEINNNETAQRTIEALTRFQTRRAHDGVEGLEAKLKAGGRSHEYLDAIEKKELFAKLLEKWSLYASAQEIFACLLASAEHQFTYFILPQISALSEVEVNQLIEDRVIVPTMNQCGADVFVMNHGAVMGMVYWLAEQCFVRWHK